MAAKVFLYTDNHTMEGAYFKGTTKSLALFELIFILYRLQLEFDFILHVIWFSGTLMIHQGTAGLSWGEENGLATCGLSMVGIGAPPHDRYGEEPRARGLNPGVIGHWDKVVNGGTAILLRHFP
jgi:hypothetical protein